MSVLFQTTIKSHKFDTRDRDIRKENAVMDDPGNGTYLVIVEIDGMFKVVQVSW